MALSKKVGIIGYGRFGRVLADLLKNDFELLIYDSHHNNAVLQKDIQSVLQADTIFLAIPIHYFATMIDELKNDLGDNTTIIDVCSVKLHPYEIMQKQLPEHVGFICTHPLFGPDSIKSSETLKWMMHASRDNHNVYADWKAYLSQQFTIVEMTPDEHDRQAAYSQGITHFLGRSLNHLGLKHTEIDTVGFHDLAHIVDQTCHDSWELFCDLQNYNPYSKQVIEQLQESIQFINQKLDLNK